MKLVKPVTSILFFLIITLCLDPSSLIQLKGLQNLVKFLAVFFQTHFDITAILLCVFFLAYIAKDILDYFASAERDEDLADKATRENSDSVGTIKNKLKALNAQVSQTQSKLIVSQEKFDKKSLKHLYKIGNTLSSINQVYDNNLKTYHATNCRLFHIVSATTLYSKEEIQPLIEQYRSLNE